ncbi:hypothetical protein SH661x_002758 [Planctomicrobium sp. SH661]|uniref:hypothetical protein n=1 Tax=Planctomicrobium sp. SH661 TaxID=3448124 RepID=UPI003F5C2379
MGFIFYPLLALIASATDRELTKYIQFLKEEEIQPGPDRTSDSWSNFLERHKETLWATDFFSVTTVTRRGLRVCTSSSGCAFRLGK